MDKFMTPENVALIVGAIAALIYAAAKAVNLISAGVSNYMTVRGDIKRMAAENDRLKAEAQARDIDAENEQQAKIISIMERQTEYSHETATRFAAISEDFLTAQNRDAEDREKSRQTNEKMADGFNRMAEENRALRISMEAWPKTVDGKLDTVDETLLALSKKVAAVETAILNGNKDHDVIQGILKEQVVAGIDKIIALLTPPPTEPDSAPKASKVTPIDADAAAHQATVDLPVPSDKKDVA